MQSNNFQCQQFFIIIIKVKRMLYPFVILFNAVELPYDKS